MVIEIDWPFMDYIDAQILEGNLDSHIQNWLIVTKEIYPGVSWRIVHEMADNNSSSSADNSGSAVPRK